MMKFKCWDVTNTKESLDDVEPSLGRTVEALSSQMAAERYAEYCWWSGACDGDPECRVVVESDDGERTIWDAEGEPTMAWCATEA